MRIISLAAGMLLVSTALTGNLRAEAGNSLFGKATELVAPHLEQGISLAGQGLCQAKEALVSVRPAEILEAGRDLAVQGYQVGLDNPYVAGGMAAGVGLAGLYGLKRFFDIPAVYDEIALWTDHIRGNKNKLIAGGLGLVLLGSAFYGCPKLGVSLDFEPVINWFTE